MLNRRNRGANYVVVAAMTASLLLASGPAVAGDEDVDALLDHMDRLYRSDTSYAEVEMVVTTPNWTRRLEIEMWTHGLDRVFIGINAPKKDAGTATLRDDREMWNYFPKIDKVMKVPPSMMMGSWMGSDFTNDDIVKENTLRDDYHATIVESEDDAVQALQLVPKEDAASVWGKIILRMRKESLLPVDQTFYDEKGRPARVMRFSEPRTFGTRTLPSQMTIEPLNKPGNTTVVRYVAATFDEPVDESIFTLRNLRRRR
ncbi:outer membrane lipoprotein-sorting protein [Candidatus Poribacteria bacterium]|nr:outer membrane lipoprotein-sorting protein [Candidatus Poribacteria bacterium]MBT5714431.1 outer membrane lipoprotein-sorting protein [Candidatus Poribacteria bacterium]MBT7101820.1 outer membrane lipoprotein-sorting protein [Candidatus Poribacteria bacterium]MBT7807558.1 outer membrane lipoprotein-sorting protein [Candidatus Poribacteria bacterium]